MFGSLKYEEEILMDEEGIKPCYDVLLKCGKYIVEGTESTTGEKVFIETQSGDEFFVRGLADFLNRHKVSVVHAKDVLRDRLLSFL